MASLVNLVNYQTFKDEIMPVLQRLLQKKRERNISQLIIIIPIQYQNQYQNKTKTLQENKTINIPHEQTKTLNQNPVFRIHKQLLQLNTNNSILKWTRDFKKHFKEDI